MMLVAPNDELQQDKDWQSPVVVHTLREKLFHSLNSTDEQGRATNAVKAIGLMIVRIDKPEDETYGEFTNDSNYTTEYSEGEISQGHNRCLQAADYKGCMEYQEGSNTRITETGSEPGTVDVTEPKPYNYDPESVMQLKIRGSYGRYLTFIGKTVNEYAGTSGYMLPGSPGSVSCNTYGGYGAYSSTYTTCNRSGYVAPTYVPGTSGGVQNRKYRYELDCQDMTFDRKGDYAGGMSNKGWMSVYNDPTAQAVANRYCSSIGSLPRAAER